MRRNKLMSELLVLVEREIDQPFAPLDEQDALKEALGLDSVDLVGLAMQVEQHFAIRIDNQELWLLRTISDLLDLLEAKLPGDVVGISGGPG